MTIEKGVVTKLESRPVKTGTSYIVFVNNAEAGTTLVIPSGLAVGDEIIYEVKMNGLYKNLWNITILTKGTPVIQRDNQLYAACLIAASTTHDPRLPYDMEWVKIFKNRTDELYEAIK